MSQDVIEEGELSNSLLLKRQPREDEQTTKTPASSSSSPTSVLLLSTLVAVCGSYVFGSAVGYSSPVQSGIMSELSLSVAEYSLFGSILTIGAMVGAIMSGRIADHIGRKATMGLSDIFCLIGWIAIAFSKVKLIDAYFSNSGSFSFSEKI